VSARLERTSTPGIYRRGSRYCVVFRDSQGKQRKRSAATRAQARVLQAALRADVARGEYRALSRVTFGEYASEWIRTYSGRTSRGLTEHTRSDYARSLERHAIPALGRRRLTEIEPRDLKVLATQIAATGVSPRTVQLALAPVKALLATAVEDGLIRTNPAANLRLRVHVPRKEAHDARVKALTETQLRRLLDALPPEWRLFHEFLAQTGLRVGEAIELRFRDLELGKRELRIARSFYRGSVGAPKSRYGARKVRLTAQMAQSLWALRKDRRASEDDLVFTARGAARIDQSNLMSRVLKPAAREAGIGEWVSFHTFRHTYATMLFRRGWNAVQVQRCLGHHKPSFTLDTYVHLLEGDLPDADFLDSITAATRGNEVATRPTEITRASSAAGGAN
jgi:integrase